MKKKNILLIVVTMVMLVIACAIAVNLNHKSQITKATFIKDAVAAQASPEDLGKGIPGTRECYVGSSAKQCLAMTYTVSKSTCNNLTKQMTNARTCNSAYGSIEYKGKTIKVYVGEGAQANTYWLQAWSE